MLLATIVIKCKKGNGYPHLCIHIIYLCLQSILLVCVKGTNNHTSVSILRINRSEVEKFMGRKHVNSHIPAECLYNL